MNEAKYGENIRGWGIDWLFSSFAYNSNLHVVVDKLINVHHRTGSGYSHDGAVDDMYRFLANNLSSCELIQYKLLNTYFQAKAAQVG